MEQGKMNFYLNLTFSYTKVGYAGNNIPQFVIPTVITTPNAAGSSSKSSNVASKRGIEDLDYFIGDEAISNSKSYGLSYPIRHGQVENWDLMEKFHQATIFQYLKCEPEDHYFLMVKNPFLL